MIERYLIEHCAPTLASLKVANLFNFSFATESQFKSQMLCWNKQLGKKGVFLYVIRKREASALVYVYRYGLLSDRLWDPEINNFLKKYGYSENISVANALHRLRTRFARCDQFPHEVGIFLGYPLEDVVGFIENAGKNSKCTGCWKVYCNECDARRTFAKYKKCKDIYMGLWNSGKSVKQLTVARDLRNTQSII